MSYKLRKDLTYQNLLHNATFSHPISKYVYSAEVNELDDPKLLTNMWYLTYGTGSSYNGSITIGPNSTIFQKIPYNYSDTTYYNYVCKAYISLTNTNKNPQCEFGLCRSSNLDKIDFHTNGKYYEDSTSIYGKKYFKNSIVNSQYVSGLYIHNPTDDDLVLSCVILLANPLDDYNTPDESLCSYSEDKTICSRYYRQVSLVLTALDTQGFYINYYVDDMISDPTIVNMKIIDPEDDSTIILGEITYNIDNKELNSLRGSNPNTLTIGKQYYVSFGLLCQPEKLYQSSEFKM